MAAVDAEDEVLDVLVQSKRNKHAPLKLMRKLLKADAFVPERSVTNHVGSYCTAVQDLRIARPRARAPEEQQSREFASADTAAGAQDAAVQEPRFRIEIPVEHAAVYNTSKSDALSLQPQRTGCFGLRR